ncbi:MAG: RluA family pseudouridine synthase [Clostridia bacterium]|nr:RluA family pseudouridine synthase [Clostridia bacterium]
MKKFTVTTDTNLKDFTDATYPQGSFVLGVLLKKGDVRVNGVKQRKSCPLKAGDEVTYYTTPAQEDKPSHTVVYEDENILVADKPDGVSSEGLFSELGGTYYPVHRLDRNTSGLIVLAKSNKAQEELIAAFKERSVEKIYLCFAQNNFKAQSATLTAYMTKDAASGTVRVFNSPAADRVKIITEYAVQKSFGDYALVKVTLHTGKTHQIRAHLSSIGCPVLGDGKYGNAALNKKYKATRQILVARSLAFHLAGDLAYLNDTQFTSNFFPTLPKDRNK